MNNKLLLLIVLLLVTPAMAGTGTISIWGTNISTAQANVTISNAPNNVTVTAWNVNGIKTFTVAVTNANDTIVITVANNSANQINEFLVNGTSINGLQVNSTGWYNITYTQKTGNATFTIRPALQSGGFNWSWGWFQYLTVVNSTTINNVIITNTTTLNATNIAGSGSGISDLNASNLTNPLAAVNGSALFGLNMSNATTCTGNITCTYQANGSVSLDAVSNTTAIFNRVLNSSTVTAGVYPNGSVELTATTTATTTLTNLTGNVTLANQVAGTSIWLHAGVKNISVLSNSLNENTSLSGIYMSSTTSTIQLVSNPLANGFWASLGMDFRTRNNNSGRKNLTTTITNLIGNTWKQMYATPINHSTFGGNVTVDYYCPSGSQWWHLGYLIGTQTGTPITFATSGISINYTDGFTVSTVNDTIVNIFGNEDSLSDNVCTINNVTTPTAEILI